MPDSGNFDINKFAAELRKARMPDGSPSFSEDEITNAVADQLEAMGQGGPTLRMDRQLAQQALRVSTGLLPVAGSLIGGQFAPALAERYLPSAVERFIPRAVQSGAGQAMGAYLGGASPGQAIAGGTLGATVEGLSDLAARAGFRVAGIKPATTQQVMAEGPVGRAALTRFPMRSAPPPETEHRIAAGLLARTNAELAGEIPMPGMAQAKEAIENYGPTPIPYRPWPSTQPPPRTLLEYEVPQGRFGQKLTTGEPGSRPGSPRLVRMQQEQPPVQAVGANEISGAPIRQHIRNLLREPIGGKYPDAAEESANAALRDAMARVPDRFATMDELESYLRRVRKPVEEALGKETPNLAKADRKSIAGFVRRYRDTLLGGEQASGPQGYKTASERTAALMQVRDAIAEAQAPGISPKPGEAVAPGELKPSAESFIKRAAGNTELMNRLRLASPQAADAARRLAVQREMTSIEPLRHPGFMGYRVLSRPLAKTAAVLGHPAGQLGAAAYQYKESPTAAVQWRQYMESGLWKQTRIKPEDMFPNMTNKTDNQ